MKNYLVLCNFAGYDLSENELFTNQWTVGSFDTLEECYKACEDDMEQVGRDAYEGMFDEDEVEEYKEKLKDFLNQKVKHHRVETDLVYFERVLIYSLEYTDDYTAESLDYSIIKIK